MRRETATNELDRPHQLIAQVHVAAIGMGLHGAQDCICGRGPDHALHSEEARELAQAHGHSALVTEKGS